MRVVGGRLKGRNLASPSSQEIRPTADRLRVADLVVDGIIDPAFPRYLRESGAQAFIAGPAGHAER